MNNKRMRVAVIGCGMISNIYLQNMTTIFHNLEVAAVCDLSTERAAERSQQYNIPARSYEDILADPDIEMVIILTPAPAHYGLIKQGLLAGKHVYTEKTITIDLLQAKELAALAEEKSLYLGAAPDTFMGAGWQKARQVVDEEMLGEITSFQLCMNSCLDINLCKYLFLRMPGSGICYDMGVYYLTNLVNLLGPIAEVCAVVENRKPIRIGRIRNSPEYGKPYEYKNEAQVTAILRTESGITGTFVQNGESIGANQLMFQLYGTKAIAQLPDPNHFGGEVKIISPNNEVVVLDNDLPYAINSRGIGPAEMANAIADGRPNRAHKTLALHVLDIIESMMASSETGAFVKVQSTCERPAPLYAEKSI